MRQSLTSGWWRTYIWGAFHCPDVQTVERHIANWAAFQKDLKVLSIIDTALQHYGRGSMLDWPTKLAIIVSKTDVMSLAYVVEALYTHMWRANEADPYSVIDLRKKHTSFLRSSGRGNI